MKFSNILKEIAKNEWIFIYLFIISKFDRGRLSDKADAIEIELVKNRTEFGKLVDNLSGILVILYLPFHYTVMSLIWFVIFLVVGTIKVVYDLFTKKWKDIM